ncbi:hypothetical protein BsWGS_22116 [Bradybaena similaris]
MSQKKDKESEKICTYTTCESSKMDKHSKNRLLDTKSEHLSADTEHKKTDTTCQSVDAVDTDTTCESVDTDTTCESVDTDTTCESVDTDSLDTHSSLTLAKLDRESQGPLEAEYSYGGEADLHQHFNRCRKNPGHKNFIPVDLFSIEHLPEPYRNKDLVEYIRVISDLTVRVTVTYVSDRRIAKIPGCDKTYPGYSARGKARVTFGTGHVHFVVICTGNMQKTCECKACLISSTPETNFAKIEIYTSTHVVFDKLEGEHTTCYLFFDRRNRPDTCAGVVAMTGMSSVTSEAIRDRCNMQHFTHDLDLAQRLLQKLTQSYELCTKVYKQLPVVGNFSRLPNSQDRRPLLFIVSHPHGRSKQISLGYYTALNKFNNKVFSCQYDAPTCPGSSGAAVYMPQYFTLIGVSLDHFMDTHCGTWDAQQGINYCHTDRDVPWLETMSLEEMDLGDEPWKDSFCCVEEEALSKHYQSCQKNPGHKQFFPADQLCMDNLLPRYRSQKIMEFIKTVSDLTVRVSVKYVSDKRPETVPGTDIPFPWYSYRGTNQMRVGNGWITEVVLFEDNTLYTTCDCKDCLKSPSPKTHFAHIKLNVPHHLVFDKQEGEHTTCHLFFDSGESPEECMGVATLSDMWDMIRDRSRCQDIIVMTFVTHNLELAARLQQLTAMFQGGFCSSKKYDCSNLPSNTRDSISDPVAVDGFLYLVVCHPHGCAKHISIVCYRDPGVADVGDNQSPKVWLSCPGFSGASVIKLGWDTIYPSC